MREVVNHPDNLVWHKGELPDVHTVPKGTWVLAWFVNNTTQEEYDKSPEYVFSPEYNGTLRRIEAVMPHSDSLNPLRWCDSSGHPIGYQEKVAFWCYVVGENVNTPRIGTGLLNELKQ